MRQAFWSIAHTIEAADYEILPLHIYVPSFGEWGFVIAAPFIPPQVNVQEGVELRYLTPEVLTAALTFDPDIAEIDADVSTLDDPVVARYYIQGWRRWD